VNLQSDDFELFGLQPQFAQDRAVIDERWKQLQRQAHPDRFADQGASAQRLALQWSVRINEAHQRLKDPLRRAAYLCQLRGAAIDAHDNTAMPAEFLVQQIEWREALAQAQGLQALEVLAEQTHSQRAQGFEQLAHSLDVTGDVHQAASWVRSLMFMERFSQEVDARIDRVAV
jgi:molecular chaperone HscB